MRGIFAIIVLLFGFASNAGAADQPDAVSEFYAGHAALQQGDPTQAISHFSKALEMGNLEETQVAYVHHYRAIAYQRLDRHQEAIDDYTQAMAIGTLPKRVQAAIYYNRAIALDHLANFDRAIKDYTQAIASKPDYAEAYMNRGNAYRKLGDNDAALRDYQSSAAYGNPIKHLPYYGEGLVLEAKGDKPAAFKAFQTALLLAPDFEPARLKVEGYQAAGMKPSIGSGTTGATGPAPTKPVAAAKAAPPSVMASAPAPAAGGPEMQINLKPQYPLPRAPFASGATGATTASSTAPSSPVTTTVTQTSSAPASAPKPAPATVASNSAAASTSSKPATPAPPAKAAPTVPGVAAPPPPVQGLQASSTAASSPKPAPAKSTTTTTTKTVAPASPAGSAAVPPPAVAPPPAASQRVASSSGGSFLVQLGAYTSENIANSEAAQILTKYGDLLTGLDQDIQRADLGEKGIYFRLRFGPFNSRNDANDRCGQLKTRGQACIIVAGAAG